MKKTEEIYSVRIKDINVDDGKPTRVLYGLDQDVFSPQEGKMIKITEITQVGEKLTIHYSNGEKMIVGYNVHDVDIWTRPIKEKKNA